MKNSVCLGNKTLDLPNTWFFVQYTMVSNCTSYLASKDVTTTSKKFKEPISVAARSKE
jgi:hypothetical protein